MSKESLQRVAESPAASPEERAAALARIREMDGAPSAQRDLEVRLLEQAGCTALDQVSTADIEEFCREHSYSADVMKLHDRHSAALLIRFWEAFIRKPDEHSSTLVALIYDGADTPEGRREIAVRELARCRKELAG